MGRVEGGWGRVAAWRFTVGLRGIGAADTKAGVWRVSRACIKGASRHSFADPGDLLRGRVVVSYCVEVCVRVHTQCVPSVLSVVARVCSAVVAKIYTEPFLVCTLHCMLCGSQQRSQSARDGDALVPEAFLSPASFVPRSRSAGMCCP